MNAPQSPTPLSAHEQAKTDIIATFQTDLADMDIATRMFVAGKVGLILAEPNPFGGIEKLSPEALPCGQMLSTTFIHALSGTDIASVAVLVECK